VYKRQSHSQDGPNHPLKFIEDGASKIEFSSLSTDEKVEYLKPYLKELKELVQDYNTIKGDNAKDKQRLKDNALTGIRARIIEIAKEL